VSLVNASIFAEDFSSKSFKDAASSMRLVFKLESVVSFISSNFFSFPACISASFFSTTSRLFSSSSLVSFVKDSIFSEDLSSKVFRDAESSSRLDFKPEFIKSCIVFILLSTNPIKLVIVVDNWSETYFKLEDNSSLESFADLFVSSLFFPNSSRKAVSFFSRL